MISLFHYGETWTRFSNLIGFVEIAVEANLQFLFQVFFVSLSDYGTRVLSWIQSFSISSSMISIGLGMSRGLHFSSSSLSSVGHQEKTMKTKLMNLTWNLLFSSIVNSQFIIHYIGFAMFLKHHFQNFTKFNQIAFLSTCTISFVYPIFSFIIINNNCYGKLHQAQLKCVLLSIYFFLCIGCWINCAVMVLSSTQIHGIGFIFMISTQAFNCLYLSMFFLYASFIVSSFMDVFDREMLESNNSCSLPSMQLGILLFVYLIFIVSIFFANGLTYYNN